MTTEHSTQINKSESYYEHCMNEIEEDMRELEYPDKRREYLFQILKFFANDLKELYENNNHDRISETYKLIDYILELVKWA
jgi:hypothetical protein